MPIIPKLFLQAMMMQGLWDFLVQPAFFIIGPDEKVTRIFGAQPYETFEKIFETELKK